MESRNPTALAVQAVTCDALARGEQIFHLLPAGVGQLPDLPHREFWLWPDWEVPDLQAFTEPYQDRMRALADLRHDDGRARLKYYATVEYAEGVAQPRELRGLDGDHTLAFGGVRALFQRAEGPVTLVVLRVHERPETALVDVGAVRRLPGDLPRERAAAAAGSGHPDAGETGDAPDAPGAADTAGPDRGGTKGDDGGARRPAGPAWIRLPEAIPTEGLEPVVPDGRFLSRKARLLQRTGSIRAV